MANTLKLEIVTPDSQTFSDDVEMVTLPGAEGEMGIYPMHVPLMTQIVAGEIIVRKDGRDSSLAVGDGFAEITGDRVAVMTDMAIKAENIDEAKAEEARRRAEARLTEKLDVEQLEMVNAALAHSIAQLKVKRRTHS
jgi:F-type H+-transporting ATPase subunit epsilon